MFIKLSYTSNKTYDQTFRLVDYLIRNPAIADTADLITLMGGSEAHADIKNGFDAGNSQLIRTNEPSTVQSSFKKSGTHFATVDWILGFDVSDDPTKKYYINLYQPSVAYSVAVKVFDGITGNFDSTTPLTNSSVTTYNPPNYPTLLSGSNLVENTAVFGNGSNIRTFWCWITNECFMWATTNNESYANGFGAGYSNPLYYNGPYIYSQYSRYDHWNTANNNIIPLMFSNCAAGRSTNPGFGYSTGDWGEITNPMWTTDNSAFKVFNTINTQAQTALSPTMYYGPQVNYTLAGRSDNYVAHAGSSFAAVSTQRAACIGPSIFQTPYTRYTSADLKTQSHAMLPIGWDHSFYNNAGGSASDKAGWYIFNGDYYPGDEFTKDGKTYIIFPTNSGYIARVGVAIPKE